MITTTTIHHPAVPDEFEFGCFPPAHSSSSTRLRRTDPLSPEYYYSSSPADHLFSNGRLLPHSFPPLPSIISNNKEHNNNNNNNNNYYSISIINNLLPSPPPSLSHFSSRSNSVSSCSSSSGITTARSSLSSSSSSSSSSSTRRPAGRKEMSTPVASRVVMAQLYGSSSQRWQHLVPPLRSCHGRRAVGKGGGQSTATTGRREKKQPGGGGGGGVCRRVLRWLLVACKECHALELPAATASNDDDDDCVAS